MSYDYLFKIIFLGDVCVGKTALVERLTHKRYNEYYHTTIGVDFSAITLDIKDDKIKTHIWDTAGQEYFSAIISTYYRGIAGAVIVFDVTNRESFKKVSFWLNEIKKHGTPNYTPVLMLVGNKIDDDSRVVFKHEAEEFASTHDMIYYETSAKKNINVEKFYHKLIEKIHDTANLIDPDEKKGIRKGFLNHSQLKVKEDRACDNLDCCTIS